LTLSEQGFAEFTAEKRQRVIGAAAVRDKH
jgi:hypothetical protein